MTQVSSGKKKSGVSGAAPRTARPRLSTKNRQLLEFLREWMSTPDQMGDEWWDKFEKDLEENRLSFDRQPE